MNNTNTDRKDRLDREQIEIDTALFLSNGGEIEVIDTYFDQMIDTQAMVGMTDIHIDKIGLEGRKWCDYL